MTQEKLQATIPAANKWHNEDIKVKAKELGIDKTELILEAITFIMSIDNSMLKIASQKSKENYLPLWFNLTREMQKMEYK